MIKKKIGAVGTLQKSLGTIATLQYLGQKARARLLKRRRPYKLRSPLARHPLWCRPGASDGAVFFTIFVQREYQPLDDLTDVKFVLDCGANVGYSSAYFLSRFPDCQVLAVEPDAANFALLKRNLAPYGKRARALHSAVWSHSADLKMSDVDYRENREYSRQVRECHEGETPEFSATGIAELLRESGHERLSILKIDIEGAEVVVFSHNTQEWLPRVDNIAIELHDDTIFGPATAPFYAACDGRFTFSHSGELTLARAKEGAPAEAA